MLVLETDELSLHLTPDYGARVTALVDRRSERQWLVTGPQSSQTGEDVFYGAAEAVGWDECFPTIAPCSHSAWGGRLRDHGALWGREWRVARADDACVETCLETPIFRFIRILTAQGATLTAHYRVSNLARHPLPYLWSQHCLLAANQGDRITLQGQGRLVSQDGPFTWPHHPARDLSAVGHVAEGFAVKAYAETPGQATAAITGPNGGIRFDWDDVPALGVWLCYGGWPVGQGVQQVALEPTTAAADDLVAAEALGRARVLAPGETHDWSVRLTLTCA